MINNRQKFILHHYKRAAALSEPAYRNVLRENAGVSSAADKNMRQSGFEQAMAALETMLFMRVEDGLVPDPIGSDKWIRSERHWRDKLPNLGMINSRQAHKIEQLWTQLKEYLPAEKRTINYLGGILSKSTGKSDVGYTALKKKEADNLIVALRDRLAHALKTK